MRTDAALTIFIAYEDLLMSIEAFWYHRKLYSFIGFIKEYTFVIRANLGKMQGYSRENAL